MFTEELQKNIFQGHSEKTYIDKILAVKDVDRVKELVSKSKLKREELLELLYLMTSNESKLVNYDEDDRHIQLLYFVWIREFVKIAEQLYDYKDDLEKRENTCRTCGRLFKIYQGSPKLCACDNPKPQLTLTSRTQKLLFNNERLIEHNVKFLVDLYFNIGRTTLSLSGTGFDQILKNKYELAYPQTPQPSQPEPKGGGIFNVKR